MSERSPFLIKDAVLAEFGPLPELTNPRYPDNVYDVYQWDIPRGIVTIQEIRPQSWGTTGFIDYHIMPSSELVSRSRTYSYKSKTDHSSTRPFNANAGIRDGMFYYRYDTGPTGVNTNGEAVFANVSHSVIGEEGRVGPSFVHAHYTHGKLSRINISPIDSPIEIAEYVKGLNEVDPERKGSYIYESYNDNMFFIVLDPEEIEMLRGKNFHSNIGGRPRNVPIGEMFEESDEVHQYLIEQEGGAVKVQRFNRLINRLDTTIVQESIDNSRFTNAMFGTDASWTTDLSDIVPIRYSRTIITSL